jgi:hypothetical protein
MLRIWSTDGTVRRRYAHHIVYGCVYRNSYLLLDLDTQKYSLFARTALFPTVRRLPFMFTLSRFRLPCISLVPYSVFSSA